MHAPPLERLAQEQGNPLQAKYLLCPYGLFATSPVTEENILLKLPIITIPPLREIRYAYLRKFVFSNDLMPPLREHLFETLSDVWHIYHMCNKKLLLWQLTKIWDSENQLLITWKQRYEQQRDGREQQIFSVNEEAIQKTEKLINGWLLMQYETEYQEQLKSLFDLLNHFFVSMEWSLKN